MSVSSRTATEQVELLRKVENRQIIKKVADDTATLRSVSRAGSVSISRGQPSVGPTEFEFDNTVLESPVYQRAGGYSYPLPPRAERRSITSYSNQYLLAADHDSGLVVDNPAFSPNPQNALALDTEYQIGDRPVRAGSKSLQRGDSTYSSLGSHSSGSKREKFRSMIRRISSVSISNAETSPVADSPNGRRSRGRDFNTSIDLKTEEGNSAPLIIKVAQTGSRQDVERLIQNNHDIEKRHLQSRRNALLVAAHCGKQEIVDLLIDNNANLEARDGTGCTALHLAASRGHVEVLESLILEGVEIDARNTQGRTALWLAADLGQLDSTRILVAAQAKVNFRADNQMTPFHVAAKRGDTEIVEHLMSYGADVEAKDASMMTALHYACENGHTGVIELLLSNKVDINAPGNDRRSPLICAAALGRLPVVQLLLNKRASSRSTDDNGMTALHWAAFNGHTESVHLLSQKRDSLSAKNVAGRTALHVAVMGGQFGVVELLLRKDNVALEARCAAGLTMLHYACLHDKTEIARLLLAAGSDIEAETTGGQQRPVHIAAASASVGLVNLLCGKGASFDARNAKGNRALCVACHHGRAAAVQSLLQRRSPLCKKFGNQSGYDSPLCLAAMGGHLPVVSLLLQHGASADQGDESGWKPARYAAYNGHPKVLELLLANSTESYQDLSADKIGFSPDATISEDQKAQVCQLLNQASRQPRHSIVSAGVRTAPRPSPLPQEVSPFVSSSFPTGNPDISDAARPYELPGNLEQGLPASRSHTPEQMRGNEVNAAHAVAYDLPMVSESRSTPTGGRTAPGPSPPPQAVPPFVLPSFPPGISDIDNAGPHELPETTEPVLPANRSHTPEQMRGDIAPAPHVVGSNGLQHAVPTASESRSTVPMPLQQPRAVSASVQWIDWINSQVDIPPSTQPAVPAVPLTSSRLSLQNQATVSSHNTTTIEQQSETSSVTSVYTAPESGAHPES